MLSGIGLGISASSPRKASGNKSPSSRRASGEQRRASGGALQSIDNLDNERKDGATEDSLPIPSSTKPELRKPKSSNGLSGLAKGSLVTRSPFLKRSGAASPDTNSPLRGNSHNEHSPSPLRGASPQQPAQDDVFSSPIPRTNSGSIRMISPIYNDRDNNANRGESPVKRMTTDNEKNLLVPLSVRSSPPPLAMEKPLPPIHVPDLNATPTKSSITKRRLAGPRGTGSESPTTARQAKTVTFQNTPDVKEFETESVTEMGDLSKDSSEGMDDSMDDIQLDDDYETLKTEARSHSGLSPSHITNYRRDGGGSVSGITELDDLVYDDRSNDGHGPRSTDSHGTYNSESMTANFIDSLVEDGYFSPPTAHQAKLAAPVEQTLPPLGPVMTSGTAPEAYTPKLDTPSFGAAMQFMDQQGASSEHQAPADKETPQHRDLDSAGIPYGRTHHAERAFAAHSGPHHPEEPIEQPQLPRSSPGDGEPVIRSANVKEPALPTPTKQQPQVSNRQSLEVHQDGVFVDPFVTIQTATKVYARSESPRRDEDGVPLGRTSHQERAKVARLLATQSLGLGLPHHPAQPPSLPSHHNRHISFGESEDGTDVSLSESEGEEMYDGDLPSPEKLPRLESPVHTSPVRSRAMTSPEPRMIASPEPRTITSPEPRVPLHQKLEQACSPRMGSPMKRTLPKPPQPKQVEVPSPKLVAAEMPKLEEEAKTSPTVSTLYCYQS